jgi:S1-C subfamily serine protease
VTKEVVEYLANRGESLTSTLKPGTATAAAPKKERKVSLGAVPDFAFKGEGVWLSGVVPGSPAEAAGLREGDLIVKINESAVKNLKDLSDILKTMKAGDRATVVFLRNGKESQVEVEVKER